MTHALIILAIGWLVLVGSGATLHHEPRDPDYEMSLSVIERHKRLDIPVRCPRWIVCQQRPMPMPMS